MVVGIVQSITGETINVNNAIAQLTMCTFGLLLWCDLNSMEPNQ